MDPKLAAFIDHARSRGMDHSTIRMLLLSAGWKEKDIAGAMTAQALDVPIPSPPDVGGAREAFLHLLTFAALYVTVIAGVSLLFDYLNLWLPDPALTRYAAVRAETVRTAIRWEMSAVIVAFPVLILLSRLMVRELRASPDRTRSPVRRWLTYLTLFVASVALAADVIALVSALLGGDVSGRFFAKVVVVLAVAGATFGYYLASLQLPAEQVRTTTLHTRAGWLASVAAVAVLVAGVVATGTPIAERHRKLDARRVEDVQTIYEEVLNISVGPDWRHPGVTPRITQSLPPSLVDVAARAVHTRPRIVDPATHVPYDYTVLGDSRFRVCASFDEPREEPGDIVWNHSAGRSCFAFDALKPIR